MFAYYYVIVYIIRPDILLVFVHIENTYTMYNYRGANNGMPFVCECNDVHVERLVANECPISECDNNGGVSHAEYCATSKIGYYVCVYNI